MIHDADQTRLDLDASAVRRFGSGAVLRERYLLGPELGRGGMGVVYRATDLALAREVAVKVMPETAATDEARVRLLREARTAATLNHPGIVTVHDVGEESGCAFFVMELVEGPTLAQARPARLEDVLDVVMQLCEALEHAHAHGLVHRDLKPDNVLLVPGSNRVKLADLGVAVPVRGSRLTLAGSIVGTVAYMAPEQAMGEAVDARSDLYSLGVVLYELTVGHTPFRGDNPLAIVSQHVNAPVVPPRALRPDLPAALEAVILKLLAKDPAQRYASAALVREALRTALVTRQAEDDTATAAVAVLDSLSRGRLVGRARELADLREFWRRARDGHSHGVLLSGEPGAGKTRLARELSIQAALDGAAVLAGASYEYEASTPYLPFAEAFRSWVRQVTDPAVLREVAGELAPFLARLAPEIETRLGPFPELPSLPPHEERLLFFDAVMHAFRALAGTRGLLFYVDDLHWADSSTLWLLGHLLRQLRDQRVLLLASYRETELDRSHPLSKALVDWNRERLITRIALRRLDASETRDQLSALLGQSVAPDLAAAVHRETEGNPFFVEEMLKALVEQGTVRREGHTWTCSPIRELHLPESLKAAIGRRLDRVSAATNDVLRAAAVLGKTFDVGELQAAASDRSEDALLDALDEAVSAQLLETSRGATFAFTHDKIRETLYEELNPIRRRRLHLRTAEGLERHRAHARVPTEKLAHHFMQAGEYERALVYSKEAAIEAERLFAYDEAVVAYARALECTEELGRRDEQGALEENIGKVRFVAGDHIAALEHFERALARVTDAGDRARLLSEAASSLVITGDTRGIAYVQEALAVLDSATHPIETATAITIAARFHHLAGRHRKAIELLERADTIVRAGLGTQIDEPSGPLSTTTLTGLAASTVTQLYAYLAGAHQHLGLFADSAEWARRVLAFGRNHHVAAAEALGFEFLAESAMNTGQWREGIEYAEREREIARRLHSRERHAWTHLPAGLCSAGLGDLARAEAEISDGLTLCAAIGERRLGLILTAALAIIVANRGRLDEALTTATSALAQADASGLLFQRTESRRALAHVHFRRGDLDECLHRCDEIVELTEGLEPKISRLHLGPLHIEALRRAGRHAAASQQLNAYAALVAECQAPNYVREVARLHERLR